jgi:hypothetical protein
MEWQILNATREKRSADCFELIQVFAVHDPTLTALIFL